MRSYRVGDCIGYSNEYSKGNKCTVVSCITYNPTFEVEFYIPKEYT